MFMSIMPIGRGQKDDSSGVKDRVGSRIGSMFLH